MLVHIGYEEYVKSDELVAMIPAKDITAETAAFIDRMRAQKRFTPCGEPERSYLLLCDGGGQRIVASCLRTATLTDRFFGM